LGVVFEGHGVADRFGLGRLIRWEDGGVVASEGGVVEPGADDAEVALEVVEWDALECAAGADTAVMKEGGDTRADAAQFTNGDMFEAVGKVFWFDDDEAVRFLLFGSEFSEELIGGDADRAGEVKAGFDIVFDHAGDVFGGAKEIEGAGDIEEGFINGGDFYERGKAFE